MTLPPHTYCIYILDTVPILSIEIEKGLSSAQTEELQALADRVAAENVGMPRCVFVYLHVCMYVCMNDIWYDMSM